MSILSLSLLLQHVRTGGYLSTVELTRGNVGRAKEPVAAELPPGPVDLARSTGPLTRAMERGRSCLEWWSSLTVAEILPRESSSRLGGGASP
ncbi:hypothetical protein PR202_gb05828 [Eleusine coracana subsp. coracana]|uniref:Secreted protein n=1 Tax=Eleusine coracana subsp. coracana TaxID=191504 RepID=A0AAV5E792_ELECO|nr:hypothetical protein PR202_gb05828 [Eleusine coracana subsp. coracana]